MANKEKVTPAIKEVKEPVLFTKAQILASGKYQNRRDILSVLLEDHETYTIEKADETLKEFMKREVK